MTATQRDVVDFTEAEMAAWVQGIREGQLNTWRFRPVTLSADSLATLVAYVEDNDDGQSLKRLAAINEAVGALHQSWHVPLVGDYNPEEAGDISTDFAG